MQTFDSNTDLSVGSDTLQNMQLNVLAMHEFSDQNGVSYRQKAKHVQSNNSHRGLSSPISLLPTEILAQIFLYCVPADENWTPVPHLSPMLLTTVCRRWREVAMDMSTLWCRLRLEVGHGNWQQRAFCYDSYLKRSRGRQLSLTLECHNNDWTELRSLLQPHVDQVSSLSLGFFSGAGSLMVADFRRLEELAIYANGSDPVVVTRSMAQLPPSMRSLKVMNLWLSLKLLSGLNLLAWAGLTNLEVVVDGLDSLPRLLRLCPNLSSLTMIGIFTSIDTLEDFVHANLQSLVVSGDFYLNSMGNHGLFNAITLPNLHALEVRNSGQWPHEEFKVFLTRSRCPLERLIFGGRMKTTDQQRAEYVTLFPSLELVTARKRSKFYI
ncbi:hypothetical protein BDR04DRAFT_413481 [Suillus decipiens]|nr:hypothetical protein BDR04DRAFT_413481 [Suillus decipiens]